MSLAGRYTHYLAAALFVYFGFKLIYDAHGMEAGAPSEELTEVEEELMTTEAAAGLEGTKYPIGLD